MPRAHVNHFTSFPNVLPAGSSHSWPPCNGLNRRSACMVLHFAHPLWKRREPAIKSSREHGENAGWGSRSFRYLHRNTEDRCPAERKFIRVGKIFKSDPICTEPYPMDGE